VRESKIEKAVNEYADLLGVLHRKFKSPNKRDVPDRIYFPHCAPAFLIEFKKAGAVPRPGQEREIARLRARGHQVAVIDNIDDGIQFINECLTQN